ncbi:MAG TPA: hypothetical protein VJI46_06765 [Candidatus Nanoarchaeia archaeon]|nr:hypothetical protein [Candidatus Nanoarchaeia archaeon]
MPKEIQRPAPEHIANANLPLGVYRLDLNVYSKQGDMGIWYHLSSPSNSLSEFLGTEWKPIFAPNEGKVLMPDKDGILTREERPYSGNEAVLELLVRTYEPQERTPFGHRPGFLRVIGAEISDIHPYKKMDKMFQATVSIKYIRGTTKFSFADVQDEHKDLIAKLAEADELDGFGQGIRD